MVDVSSIVLVQERLDIVRTLFEVIQNLEIGVDDNLVALYGYDTEVHEIFDLQSYLTKTSVLHHIQSSGLLSSLDTKRTDTDAAVQFLVDSALTSQHGDRVNFADAVVIFGDSVTAHNTHVTVSNRLTLEQISRDVIVVSVGSGSTNDNLATDRNHILHVPSSSSFDTVLVPKLLELLKQC